MSIPLVNYSLLFCAFPHTSERDDFIFIHCQFFALFAEFENFRTVLRCINNSAFYEGKYFALLV